ncbi:MAG: indolepyruvate ferredoxin oxidoreductase family protein, partial [Pseudomonadota bacterium]
MASEAGGAAGIGHNQALKPVHIDDKYDLGKDQVFITGTQAVIRLTLMQKERDRQAGLNTAGYVTGYRGSPIGGLDLAMYKVKSLLTKHDVVFEPGLNEDLAATAVWGSQQAQMRGEGKYDGVFSIWYGKGPGVDRSGDVFRHANFAGTSPHGGALALMGDDHVAESSTTAHQSEFTFVNYGMPVLSPAGVQEILDYGIFGYGLSRYASVWVGIKCVKDTIESTAVVDGRMDRMELVEPADDNRPADGLHIRPGDTMLPQEERLFEHKHPAVLAYLEANKINKTILAGGRKPRIGVVTAGKSYLDVAQALDDLGIDEARAAKLGLRLFKLGCVWPVVPAEVHAFAKGLDQIIVVEEKKALIEQQLREELYETKDAPSILGKKDETGAWLFPAKAALDSNQIAIAIGERLGKGAGDKALNAAVQRLRDAQETLKVTQSVANRVPYFCAGCPHNSSTHVPEGSRAYAGIGCHFMAIWMDRSTEGFTQMGGEGANWIGEAPFSKRDHVFQ